MKLHYFYKQEKDNKTVEINTPVLKELAKFQVAMESKNIKELENLSMQNDFFY